MEGALGLDPHSYANFDKAIVTHYALDLRTDFKRKIFYGHVDVTSKVVGDQTDFLSLDVKALDVKRISISGNNCEWLYPTHSNLGSHLRIVIPHEYRKKDSEFTVRIEYSTTPESGAIQWLEPSQTAGKIYPYCYTQGEAILNRSLLPCQDTPRVKTTYSAKISCPAPLMAVCSGIPVNEGPIMEDDDYVSYSYQQPNPIPCYLIALVVGKLEKGKVGPRSSVYTEKELLDASVHEFSLNTENYLRAAEEITGIPYDWGVYDMVVLPSAFPYGGMENPNLTFLSASLLTGGHSDDELMRSEIPLPQTGDHSNDRVVAHEATHSWFGNYTTNASWSDFWLNEGFTVFVERKIIGRVTSREYRHFEMRLGYSDLKKTIEQLKDHPEWTKLRPNLDGIDPDEAFSKVPYEKGSLFLFFLELQVGEEAMNKWLKSYVTTFRNKSLNSDQMKEHFLNYFADVDLSSVDWDDWFYSPGLPSFDPTTVLDDSLTVKCSVLSEEWLNNHGQNATKDDLEDFKARQVMFFLDEIITKSGLLHEVLERMNSLYNFSQSLNVEIQFRWWQLCLKGNYLQIIPQVGKFLSRHGRGLYVKPLYKLLHEVDHPSAVTIYRNNRPYYHSVIRSAFDKDLEYS